MSGACEAANNSTTAAAGGTSAIIGGGGLTGRLVDVGTGVGAASGGSMDAYGQADTWVCYSIMGAVLVYTLAVYFRERFYLKKSYTLRTFILLLTSMSCGLMAVYTVVARNEFGWLNQKWGFIGDISITVVSLYQYFFVVSWFRQLAYGKDDEFDDTENSIAAGSHVCIALRPSRLNLTWHALVLSYAITASCLLALSRLDFLQLFQDACVFCSCILFYSVGIYYIVKVLADTNVLDISAESYSVVERARYTSIPFSVAAVVAAVLCGLSMFMTADLTVYTNIVDTRYYSCTALSCLISFLVRVVLVVAVPNIALAYTFSSPCGRRLHLIPLHRSSSKYTAIPTQRPLTLLQ